MPDSLDRPTGTEPVLAPSVVARQPVAITNLAGALVFAIISLLRDFGVPLTEGQQTTISSVAGLIILIGVTIVSRMSVTPLVDPRDDTGRPLVPAPPKPVPPA